MARPTPRLYLTEKQLDAIEAATGIYRRYKQRDPELAKALVDVRVKIKSAREKIEKGQQ